MTFHANPDPSAVRTLSGTGGVARPLPHANPRSDWSDDMLMAAITSRDELAFAVLYDRYADLVYSASLRVLSDPQLAEDAAQDVFTRLWNQPRSFIPERGRFLSWLMSVTRNRAVDELRSRGRRIRREMSGSVGEQDDILSTIPDGNVEDPLRAAQLGEQRSAVLAALAAIPADQRQALELAYFGGLTQQEIAEKLGEPLGTVKTRIRLGMQKLRRSLKDQV